MTAEIDFYFDFLSPYSYIAFRLLREVYLPAWSKNNDDGLTSIKLNLKPVSLPHIIKNSGNVPPASVPARGVFLLKDLERSFQFHDLGKLKLPETFPFDSRNALFSLIQKQLDEVKETEIATFILKTWSSIFQNGSPQDVSPEFDSKNRSHLRDKLLENTEEALEVGAFGVPFWRIKNNKNEVETFFGSDRFNHISKFIGSDANTETVNENTEIIKSKL